MQAVANYVANPNNPFHRFMFGITFARAYNELCTYRSFVLTDSLQKELDWMSLSLVRYAKEISQFVKQANAFQKTFLLGSYQQASEILETIISEFGFSLWSLEKTFLLAEYAHGLERNKKELTNIIGDEKNDELLKFIAEYISLRCESKMSDENYRIRLSRGIDFDDDFFVLVNYLRYRLEQIGMDLTSVATHITYFEGSTPIIDRYLTFITILQSCAIADQEYSEIAKNVVVRLDGLIEDLRIDSLLQLFIPDREFECNTLAVNMIEVLDNYTNGYYEISAEMASQILTDNPESYEFYYIYIRSLAHIGKAFNQFFPEDSVAASILEHSNVIIRGKRLYNRSFNYLSKLSTSLWRDPLAYGLFDFYVEEALPSQEKRIHKLMLLNAHFLNPRFAIIYEDKNNADKFLNQLSSQVGEGSTLSLMRAITASSHKFDDVQLPEEIPEARRQIYLAEIYEKKGRFQSAISVLQPLLIDIMEDKLPGGFYSCERVAGALFRCYLERKQLAECTDMVVSSFLQNDLLTKKLPLIQLVKSIDETGPIDVMRKISYPILYSIVHTKPREVYVAYDNFLNSMGLSRPTQLFDMADEFSPSDLQEFLLKVCTIDVLSCSYHFNGTKDLETERIRICQFLSEKDQTRLKIYSDEISSITSRSLIREGMRQIEVSKIHVDEKGIRTTGRKLLEESFARYRELASMSSIKNMRVLNQESLYLYIITRDGKVIKAPISTTELKDPVFEKQIVHNALFINFRELFMDVRDRFISSGEHGLDGYLSVRIRHGVLQNQIRSTFEALHLISEKDTTTEEYLINPYWDTRLEDVSVENRAAIQEQLANFSRDVDALAQRLNKELIQVKTEKKNTDGLFDYSFSTIELYQIFVDEFLQITDFDQFMDCLFGVLWTRLKINLENIQNYISVELKNTIYESISQLEREIRKIVSQFQAAELLQNIARCQTNLQYSMDSVAQWFTISGSSIVPQFTLENLVSICIESINNIYPHKKIYPENYFSSEEVIIDGKFFAPFFDILRTIMDNAITHSGLPPEKIKAQIIVQVIDNRLTMQIKNSLEKQVRESDPIANLKTTHSLIETAEVTGGIAKEGRSGLMKVRKLMAIDLQRKDSSLDFFYDNEENFVVKLSMEIEELCI